MARKKSDDLADSFATEESGGWLTRFLADEEELDNQAKWRLASWAAGSLGALVIAILASQTATDRRRDQVAAADLARQSQTIQQLAKQSQSEASRLAAAIETLNGDRDRLYARLGSIEQGLDSVTGSIARVQAAAKPSGSEKSDKAFVATLPEIPVKEPAHAAPPIAAVDSKATMPAPSSTSLVQPTPSASKRPAAVNATESATPPAAVSAPEPPAPILAAVPPPSAPTSTTPPPAAPPTASWSAAMPALPPAQEAETKRGDKAAMAAISPAMPLMPPRSMLAPPDSAAGKLIEPRAATPPVSPAADPDVDSSDETPVAVPHTEFGVELGAANSVEGLRSLWRRVSKAHKQLKDMRPIIMVKESASGGQLRLVAGPLNDAAAAARLCAMIDAADHACETSLFDGQRLPLISTTPPARTQRKRPPKVTAAPEPPAAPEPQAPAPAPKPASLTSILGLR